MVDEVLNYLKSLKQIFPKNIPQEYLDIIEENVPSHIDIKEKIFLFMHNLNDIPVCEYNDCGQRRKFISMTKGYKLGCSKNHSTKLTNLQKYGVENPQQNTTIKNKTKQTNLEKYGADNPAKSDLVKEKTKLSYLEKTGFESPLKNPKVLEKIKHTNIEKYGVENVLQKDSIVRDRYKKTMLVKYGTEIPLRNDEIIERMKKTNIKKYGSDVYVKSNKFKEKTLDEYYDKKLTSEEYCVKPLFTKQHYIEKMKENSFHRFDWECKICGNNFKSNNHNKQIPICRECNPFMKSGVSRLEKSFRDIIGIGYGVEYNNRNVLKNGFELDIFVPSKKLAIEFNGIYWHSELNGKDNYYHIDKTQQCSEKGIQLIHVFDVEWLNKKDIIKSIIKSKLGQFETRLFARKCVIKEIDSKTKNQFLDKNHLQGQDKSSVKLGLFHNDELVSVMTFGKSRYNKNYQYELHRFCNKIGYQVVGGASKLLKHFINEYDPNSIITYADRRYSDGTFYEKIGFTKLGVTSPNYFYFGSGINGLASRNQFQKHLLNEKLETFNPELSEWENMQLNGYDRIWDCGNHKFEWIKE